MAIVVFRPASALCGVAASVDELAVFRVLQVLSGGMLAWFGHTPATSSPTDHIPRCCSTMVVKEPEKYGLHHRKLYSALRMRDLHRQAAYHPACRPDDEPRAAKPTRSLLRRRTRYGWCEGSVIVAMDPLGPRSDALQTGIRLALQQSNRLVLLALARDPSHWMNCSGIATPFTWESVREQNIEETRRACFRLVGRVPTGVPLTFAVACGRAERIIDQVVADAASSQLVLARTDFKHRRMRDWDRAEIELYVV